MTAELSLLAWSAVLTFVQAMIPATILLMSRGMPLAVGNREDWPAGEGLCGRAQRAHRNMLENLPIFAALILVAHVGGASNDMTLLGAQLFFWARLVYAVVYIAGVPWVRTLVWFASVVGMVMIFLQLL